MLGTVKWFNKDKGFGIITPNSGDDVFAHYTHIVGEGCKFLSEGECVDFEIEQGRFGPQAVQIKKLL